MMTHNTLFRTHASMNELVDQYDGFILDQFGVMHNGLYGLEGASQCVQQLATKGKRLVILSNSSSLSHAAMERLPKLGFRPDWFLCAVTSGQKAAEYIRVYHANQKALFFTWKTPKTPSPLDFIQYCQTIQVTDQVQQADFVILHGCEVLRGPGEDGQANELELDDFPHTGSMNKIVPILQQCIDRKLIIICANPDFLVVRPDGSTGHMPGEIAQRYVELGGSVKSFGKPHREHFQACIEALQLPKERIVHVGDSLHHDIAGASATGIDSIFVVGGVHREELGCGLGTLPTDTALEQLFRIHRQTPTHVVPMLKM